MVDASPWQPSISTIQAPSTSGSGPRLAGHCSWPCHAAIQRNHASGVLSFCTETFTAVVEAKSDNDVRRVHDGDNTWEYPRPPAMPRQPTGR